MQSLTLPERSRWSSTMFRIPEFGTTFVQPIGSVSHDILHFHCSDFIIKLCAPWAALQGWVTIGECRMVYPVIGSKIFFHRCEGTPVMKMDKLMEESSSAVMNQGQPFLHMEFADETLRSQKGEADLNAATHRNPSMHKHAFITHDFQANRRINIKRSIKFMNWIAFTGWTFPILDGIVNGQTNYKRFPLQTGQFATIIFTAAVLR